MTGAVRMAAAEVRIGGRRILGPLDLDVGVGERWVLLGPNGSGKTTALTLAGAWGQPSSGVVEILGSRLGRVDVRQLRRRIGHVSHRVGERLRGDLSALDTVLTGRDATLATWWQRFDGEDLDTARGLLTAVGCAPLADRPIATCSLGERQRILIARALFGDHDLLLLMSRRRGSIYRARVAAARDDGCRRPDERARDASPRGDPIGRDPRSAPAGRLAHRRGADRGHADERSDGSCFGIPIAVERVGGRWSARAR